MARKDGYIDHTGWRSTKSTVETLKYGWKSGKTVKMDGLNDGTG